MPTGRIEPDVGCSLDVMIATRWHIQLCRVNASLDLSSSVMMVYRVLRGGTDTDPEQIELRIIIDGSDTLAPVATIIEPQED